MASHLADADRCRPRSTVSRSSRHQSRLAGAEVELAPLRAARERRLARRSHGASRRTYDYVLLDCPPSLGLLTVNALTAADAVLIPIQCEYYALEGLTQLIATINLVRDHLNPDLAIKGVVLTMFDARTNLSADVAAEVRRHLGDAVFDTVIPRSVRLSEAPSYGLPIALYRADSKGAEAYRALAAEFCGAGTDRCAEAASQPSRPARCRAAAAGGPRVMAVTIASASRASGAASPSLIPQRAPAGRARRPRSRIERIRSRTRVSRASGGRGGARGARRRASASTASSSRSS